MVGRSQLSVPRNKSVDIFEAGWPNCLHVNIHKGLISELELTSFEMKTIFVPTNPERWLLIKLF
jgi:hypothetical protein